MPSGRRSPVLPTRSGRRLLPRFSLLVCHHPMAIGAQARALVDLGQQGLLTQTSRCPFSNMELLVSKVVEVQNPMVVVATGLALQRLLVIIQPGDDLVPSGLLVDQPVALVTPLPPVLLSVDPTG